MVASDTGWKDKGVRRLAAAIVPDGLKRRHESWSTSRYRAVVDPAAREFVLRYGTRVLHGPLRGLEYSVADGGPWSNDVVAKLTGSYECELHPALEEWIAAQPSHVVDVGCAEGFYAVGLARVMRATTVHAFDVDERARAACAAVARANHVDDRVRIAGLCDAGDLRALPVTGVALLADCEGCERTLLDPALAPVLRGWPMIVELHEFLDPGIEARLRERFGPSHDIELVAESPRDPGAVAELGFLSPRVRARVLDERRPAPMRWAVLRPRGRS